MLINKPILGNTKYIYVVITALFLSCISSSKLQAQKNPWKEMEEIIKKIPTTNFPDKNFNINEYGAISDGVTDNTLAFKKAIEACVASGGGKVVVPDGKYLTGAIHLDNNVNLYLTDNAEILFSTNPKDYPIVHTSFEGTEMMNYSPFIYAYKKTNVAVTGKGTLNGQSSTKNWWTWAGKGYGWEKGMPSQNDPLNRPTLVEMGEIGTPVAERVFGEGHYIRPNFLEFFECNTVLVKDVKIIDVPSWVIHPMKSRDVIVDGVTIISHGPNNDGCDPEYSQNVIIRNCTFNTGDDCIAIKSGRDGDGRRVGIPSKNIIVQNCKMIDGHGGVVMGSEISAGVSNVFVENCIMDSPNLDRAIRIKTNSKRGGLTENVYVRNIEVGTVAESVLRVTMFYDIYGSQVGDFIPAIRNINLENIKVKNGGKYGILADGYKESPIENITFTNVTIEKVGEPYSLKHVKNIKFNNTYINGVKMKNIK